MVVALFALQALLIAPLLTGQLTHYRGSIEAAYITDARFIVDHFPDLSWNPFWYLGFPFEWFYTPLLPALVALLGKVIGDVPAAYRVVAASGLALGPAALYLAAREVSRSRAAGIFAALAFIFLPSVSYLLPGLQADASGFYVLPLLSPGTYKLRATADKYQAQEVHQLVVPVAGRLAVALHDQMALSVQ